jgi:hypothetical protein
VERPEPGSPSNKICLDGKERLDETESRIEDHKFVGGAEGCSDGEGEGGRLIACNLVTHLQLFNQLPIPGHEMASSSLPPSNCTSIDTNGWSISAYKYPISNATQLESLQGTLGFPLPEMTFGNNRLVLKHNPSGWEYSFDTISALETVKSGDLGPGDGAVKVGYADAWLKSR